MHQLRHREDLPKVRGSKIAGREGQIGWRSRGIRARQTVAGVWVDDQDVILVVAEAAAVGAVGEVDGLGTDLQGGGGAGLEDEIGARRGVGILELPAGPDAGVRRKGRAEIGFVVL